MLPSSSILSCLLGSLLGGLVAGSPIADKRAPAVAAASDTLPLRRRINHKPHATHRSNFKSIKALDLAPYNPKPVVKVAYGDEPLASKEARQAAAQEPIAEGIGPAINAHHQVEYLTPTKAGGKTYNLIIDTGSSDTWFVKSGFRCLDYRRQSAPFETCDFGPVWTGGFPGGSVPTMHFNITYGSSEGPFLNGEMGYTDFTVANITVPKQQIALATDGMWFGDGISSGILGLGLPALTEQRLIGRTRPDGGPSTSTYDPIVTSVNKQIKRPIFSLALHRNESKSFIAFGGVPPQVKTTGPWAKTRMEKLRRRDGVEDYFYYTIQPDGFIWNSSSRGLYAAPVPGFIVDSGTTLNLFPYEIAASINSLFQPPAVLDRREGAWFVPCNATPPSLGVGLGGTVLWTDPTSMILPEIKNWQGLCATGISATNGFPYILGDVFMQNLVTVFDLSEKMEIRYAQRAP